MHSLNYCPDFRVHYIEIDIKRLSDELINSKSQSKNIIIKEQIKLYEKLVLDKSDKEIKEIRQKIKTELYRLVEEIVLYNNHKFEINDDIRDISSDLEAELRKKKYRSKNTQEAYLLTTAGQKLYNKYNRFVKIRFKNGVIRTLFVSGMNIKNETKQKFERLNRVSLNDVD